MRGIRRSSAATTPSSAAGESESSNKLGLRAAEVSLFGPVDHMFDGLVGLAAHEENGEVMFELHELTISSSKLFSRTNIRLGKFALGLGRLNRFHQHDWAFTTAPKVHRDFFDKEGVFDTGVEVSHVFPSELNLALTVGTTSGYTYGHSHTTGSKPEVPTNYLRLTGSTPFSSTNGLQYGLNYLNRVDANQNSMTLIGLDVTVKTRSGKHVVNHIQSELWSRLQDNSDADFGRQIGSYIFYDRFLSGVNYLGMRIDAFKDTTKRNSLNGKLINNIDYLGLLQYTIKPSEFTRYRLSLSRGLSIEEGSVLAQNTALEIQTTFILGSHPAHDF